MEDTIRQIMNESVGGMSIVPCEGGSFLFVTRHSPSNLAAKDPTVMFVSEEYSRPVYVFEHGDVKNMDKVPREGLIEGLWQVKRSSRVLRERARSAAEPGTHPAVPRLESLIPARS